MLIDVLSIAYNTVSKEEDPNIPFPQADTFDNIIKLLNLLYKGDLNKYKITDHFKFTSRQTDYYTNSAIYLGFVEKRHIEKSVYFTLSEKGYQTFSLPEKEKHLAIIKSIFEHSVFKRAYIEWYEEKFITKDRVVEIMLEEDLRVASDSTLYRRARTIICWIEWINDIENKMINNSSL
ncbi:hypothetical protein D8M04_13550 [Oceanobacillus piezotolerans]|uniref:DUF7226 domain-containing protein n=1 Tax=Oceanobacillus piezotolerans TaxID=2448030 RepID=A0A498D7C8_9BACI|nr:hypothetical protein [Oceanobacillus piezotolerans]RLL43924.1 hypothetical protein D8M04_13550 [Oceanobacillus piezotolerans]